MKTTIGKNIKKFRTLANLTQTDLARKALISRNYLSLLENNQREPSIATLERISKALDIPTSVLTLRMDTDSQDPLDKLLLKTYELATKTD